MGTLLMHTSINITVIFQGVLVIGVMMFPLLFRERSGEKLLPWTNGKSMMDAPIDALRSPLSVVKDLVKGFSARPTFSAAVFILFAFIGSGISSAFLPALYTKNLGWAPDTYAQVVGIPGTILEFFGALLGGYIADKIGQRKIIVTGYGAYGLLTIAFGLLSDYWTSGIPGCTSL
jgi:PAT family beta-lactamase induction signal transducer AmpG